eukprot:4827142-Heterocapsa_arctica.AAC.1
MAQDGARPGIRNSLGRRHEAAEALPRPQQQGQTYNVCRCATGCRHHGNDHGVPASFSTV